MIKATALLLVPALLALLAGPAAAQDDDGWDVTEASGALIASASYESGQAFAVRCRDGRLDVMMTGLPVETGEGRRFRRTDAASIRSWPPATSGWTTPATP